MSLSSASLTRMCTKQDGDESKKRGVQPSMGYTMRYSLTPRARELHDALAKAIAVDCIRNAPKVKLIVVWGDAAADVYMKNAGEPLLSDEYKEAYHQLMKLMIQVFHPQMLHDLRYVGAWSPKAIAAARKAYLLIASCFPGGSVEEGQSPFVDFATLVADIHVFHKAKMKAYWASDEGKKRRQELSEEWSAWYATPEGMKRRQELSERWKAW